MTATWKQNEEHIELEKQLAVYSNENFDELNNKFDFENNDLKYEKKVEWEETKYIIYIDDNAKFEITNDDFELFKEELKNTSDKELTDLYLNVLKEEIWEENEELKSYGKLWTFELIKKNEKLYNKYIEIYTKKHNINKEKAEEKLKKLSLKVNAPVRSFLKSMLDKFPEQVIDSMSVGIQLALMETFVSGDGSMKFLESFGEIDPDSGKGTFMKLFGLLAEWWNLQKLAKTIQNAISYLDTNEAQINNAEKIALLANPYLFKNFVTDKKREKTQISSISDIKFVIDGQDYSLVDESSVVITEKQKKEISDTLDKLTPKITEDFITKMEKNWWYLNKASKFIENRWKYQAGAVNIMEAVETQIQSIPIIGKMFSIEKAWEWLGKHKVLWWIVNLVLRFMWFSEWFTGLEKKYQQTKLTNFLDNMSEDSFIKAAFSNYQNNIYQKKQWLWENEKLITNDDPNSTWTQVDTSTIVGTWVKNKIPADFEVLQKSFVEEFSNTKIHPSIMNLWNISNYIDTKTMTVPKNLLKSFVKEYLQTVIPIIGISFNWSDVKLTSDDFLFALLGFLKAGNHFIRWMKLWILNKNTYKIILEEVSESENSNQENSEVDESWNNIQETVYTKYKDSDLEEIGKIDKNTCFIEQPKFTWYLISLEGEFWLPSCVLKNLCKTESWGYLFINSKIKWSKSWALWLFQFMPNTAYEQMLKLQKDNTKDYWLTLSLEEFKNKTITEKREIIKPFITDPVLSARACAVYLKSFFENDGNNPDIIQKLSRYNRGPGNTNTALGTKKIITADVFCQNTDGKFTIRNQTQKYILKIVYGMIKDTGVQNPLDDEIFWTDKYFKNIQTLLKGDNLEEIKTKIQEAFDIVNKIKTPIKQEEETIA